MKNKTLLKLLLCGLIGTLSLGIGACGGDNDGDGVISTTPPAVEVEEASLSLNMKKVTLPLFGRATIVATLKNSTEAIVWATSDSSVVTVQNGELYGCKEGTATITVTHTESGATATVNVKTFDTYIGITDLATFVTIEGATQYTYAELLS